MSQLGLEAEWNLAPIYQWLWRRRARQGIMRAVGVGIARDSLWWWWRRFHSGVSSVRTEEQPCQGPRSREVGRTRLAWVFQHFTIQSINVVNHSFPKGCVSADPTYFQDYFVLGNKCNSAEAPLLGYTYWQPSTRMHAFFPSTISALLTMLCRVLSPHTLSWWYFGLLNAVFLHLTCIYILRDCSYHK